MRYDLADYEWVAIKQMLPNKPRGVPRGNSCLLSRRKRRDESHRKSYVAV
jgi:hypothetical protein